MNWCNSHWVQRTVHSERIQTHLLFHIFCHVVALCWEYSNKIPPHQSTLLAPQWQSKNCVVKRVKTAISQVLRPFNSVLSWSTFGSDYNRESCDAIKLCTTGFGDFLPFSSADPLKLCQPGWGPWWDSQFQVSTAIRVELSQSHFRVGLVLRVVFWMKEVLSAREQVSPGTVSQSLQAEVHPHTMAPPPPCLTVWGGWRATPCFLHTWRS